MDLRIGHWDFHDQIAQMLKWRFPDADKALATQIDEIDASKEDIVVCATTEFGRDPHINQKGGRHHWLHAHSQLFFGKKFPRGKVVGETDSEWYPIDSGIPLKDIKHAVLHAAGGEVTPENLRKVEKIFEA